MNDLPADFGERIRDRVQEPARRARRLRQAPRRATASSSIAWWASAPSAREDAISWGLTGPLLRATGVAYDVRKAEPYLVYDRLRLRRARPERSGDNYDRFLVRFAEMQQSMRIIEQALAQIPGRPDHGRRPALRAAAEAGGLRLDRRPDEPLQAGHRGQKIPAGEVYVATEGGNGELGFYLVSDGSGRPYRVRVRPPCFYGMAALGDMLRGAMVADIITTFGQINMIGGECDR